MTGSGAVNDIGAEVVADALQSIKFPLQQSGGAAMERFELLEALRQKLLSNL